MCLDIKIYYMLIIIIVIIIIIIERDSVDSQWSRFNDLLGKYYLQHDTCHSLLIKCSQGQAAEMKYLNYYSHLYIYW